MPPAELVGKLPRKDENGNTVYLDFLGHAHVRAAFLEADLGWTWEPYPIDGQIVRSYTWHQEWKDKKTGEWKSRSVGMFSMWIRVTVGGVTRFGIGTCLASKQDYEKELLSDALRNAGISYGVALSLWAKEWEHDAQETSPGSPVPQDPPPVTPIRSAPSARAVPERELAHPTQNVRSELLTDTAQKGPRRQSKPSLDERVATMQAKTEDDGAARLALRQRIAELNKDGEAGGRKLDELRSWCDDNGVPRIVSDMSGGQAVDALAFLNGAQ